MKTDTWTRVRRGLAVALFLVVPLVLAACSPSSHSSDKASAKAAASSVEANPTVSSDLNAGAQELLTNLQSSFQPTHPVKSVEAAVRATYPQGSTGKIVSYAVKTFTLSDVHPLHGTNPARDKWLQNIDTYATGLGTAAKGQAAVPGVTAPAPSTTGSH